MKNILTTLIIGFMSVGITMAQQDPMYTQYMFNPLSVNPAYAGSAGITTFTGIYRHQWIGGMEGTPKTHSYTGHGLLLSQPIGIGGTLMRDTHGPVANTSVYVDASYILKLDDSRLAFGLKGGMNFFSAGLVDLNPVEEGDPVFGQDIKNKLLPNFGFGALLYSKTYYVGLSIPKLINNKLIKGELPDFELNTQERHYFLTAGMVFDINSYVKFKPSFLVKATSGAPMSYDISANFLFYERLWAGVQYRKQDSIDLLFQYEVNRKVKVGYSYDIIISSLSPHTGGSHEVMLSVDLIKQVAGDKSPRYF